MVGEQLTRSTVDEIIKWRLREESDLRSKEV